VAGRAANLVAALLDGIAGRAGRGGASAPSLRSLLVAIVVAGALYGAAMGAWRLEGERWKLVVFVAIKSPLLIMATTAVVLPAFFVLNTVAGLRDDFGAALRAIFVGQAGLTLALASLAPITQLVYLSGVGHRAAIMTNAAMFTVAAVVAQVVMVRHYRGLIACNRKHLLMLVAWLVLYAFVGTQMGWMLRPFIGHPQIEPAFFREGAFTNAYVEVVRIVMGR